MHSVESVCSTCLTPLTAEIVKDNGAVFLRKVCPVHGEELVLESSSEDFYFVSPVAAELSSPKIMEEPLGPSCVALLEITDACNLECPLCFSESNPHRGYFMSLEEFKSRIGGLLNRKKSLDIVMISGGEPTVHPELGAMLKFATSNPAIGRVLLNTNGVLLASNKQLQDSILANREKLEIYLQLDSLEEATTLRIRGKSSLLERKLTTVNWLTENNLPTTFAVALSQVAPADRDAQREDLSRLFSLALGSSSIRGVTLQPAFRSGRYDLPAGERLTTPDVVKLACAACPDLFNHQAFTNLPCSHPNCAIVAYFFRKSGKLWPLSQDIVPIASIKNRINYNLDDLKACGCEATELGRYIASSETSADNSFRIVVKPFMDRFTLNRDRTKQCCTHVVGPDSQAMSFCEYNVFRNQLNWNVNSPT